MCCGGWPQSVILEVLMAGQDTDGHCTRTFQACVVKEQESERGAIGSELDSGTLAHEYCTGDGGICDTLGSRAAGESI